MSNNNQWIPIDLENLVDREVAVLKKEKQSLIINLKKVNIDWVKLYCTHYCDCIPKELPKPKSLLQQWWDNKYPDILTKDILIVSESAIVERILQTFETWLHETHTITPKTK